MRTFARVFNIASGLIATVLNWIIVINEQRIAEGIIINGIFLFVFIMFELVLSKTNSKDFKGCAKVILGGWIVILLLRIPSCYYSFKDAETYNNAIDAYNNGKYEEALDGFMKVEGMYDTDDYLENVVRLRGTDVEVVR